MKKSWIILLVMIILIVNIIEFVNASGESISLNYPSEVYCGDVFEVNLSLFNFTKEMYDVKVELTNGTSTHNIAKRYFNSQWESTYNWMYNHTNTSITNNSIIKLNITENYNLITNLTILIKEDGKSTNIIEKNYPITLKIKSSSTPPSSDSDEELSIDMDWDEDEIINGLETFDIDVIAKNLDDEESYDIKVWIQFEDNDTIISQTYDENDTWVSSDEYYNQFFENEINKTKSITLRIKDNYKTYHGDAIIKLRLRKTSSSTYTEEISKDIVILEKDEDNNTATQAEEVEEPIQEIVTTNNSQIKTIKLGSSLGVFNNSIQENKNPIVYESSNEKIKKYAVFGFAGLCLVITILALFNKLN